MIIDNNTDFKAEVFWLKECGKFDGIKKTIDTYSFSLIIDQNTSLCLSGYNRGNALMKINANTTYVKGEPKFKDNIFACQMKYNNGIPFIAYWAKKNIFKDDEILLDYGEYYWSTLRNKNIEEIIPENIKLTDRCVQVLKIDKPINDGPIRLYTNTKIKKLESCRQHIKTEGEHNFYEFNLNDDVNKFSVLDNYVENLSGLVPMQPSDIM